MAIMAVYGVKVALREGQVHVSTLLWLTLMDAYFYEQLPIKSSLWRFFYSGVFTFWFFEMHDVFWYIGTFWLGVRVGLPTIYPDRQWYQVAFFKYFDLLFITTFFLRHYLKPTKRFFPLFLFQVFCHAVVIAWQYLNGDLPYTFFIIQMLYDTLPYFFIVKRHG